MLANRMRAAAAGGATLPPEMAFIDAVDDQVDRSEYTVSSADLGEADSNRLIAVAIAGEDTAGHNPSISSVTIGGQSASIVQITDPLVGVRDFVAAVAYAVVPTGATGDIVVTFNETVLSCAIGWWRIVNLQSTTPYDSATGKNTPLSIDFAPFGVGVFSATDDSGGANHSWSGATERYQIPDTGSVSDKSGADHQDSGSGETGRSVDMNAHISFQEVFAGVTWR